MVMEMVWGRDPYGYTGDPFDEFIRRLNEDMMRLMSEVEREFMNFTPTGFSRTGVREPLVDIFREKDTLVITVEMPGVRKEDISVKFLDKTTLEVSAEYKNTVDRKTEEAVYVERVYSRYNRIIKLPLPVKPETARARYNNGVLEIRVKIDEKEVKKIEGIPVKVE